MTSPLRHLLKVDVQWVWDASHSRVFRDIKNSITKIPGNVLQFCDIDKPLCVQVKQLR